MLVLETLCGRWLRAGEHVRNAPTLMTAKTPRAQAAPPQPAYRFGERLRVRGLTNTASGMPTAALADEILLEGEGQVRALLSCNGNPAVAWPNQHKTARALCSLELMVQIDPWMSQTARLADYVLAPKMSLEMAGMSQMTDVQATWFTGYGPSDSFAQYTDAIATPPEESDLIEEWEVFYGLARRMDLPLSINAQIGLPITPIEVDMRSKPSTPELLQMLSRGSRVPLEEVRKHPHGEFFPTPAIVVQPKDPDWPHKLDVGNADMMEDLERPRSRPHTRTTSRRAAQRCSDWCVGGCRISSIPRAEARRRDGEQHPTLRSCIPTTSPNSA